MVIKCETTGQFHAARGISAHSQCLLITLAASSMKERIFV
jgi:hypothetical protein